MNRRHFTAMLAGVAFANRIPRFVPFAAPEPVSRNLAHCHEKTGKPVLLADHADVIRLPDGSQQHNGASYVEMLRRLREHSGCVGFHPCGAYLHNENRKRALRDAAEKHDVEVLQFISKANQEAQAWMRAVQ